MSGVKGRSGRRPFSVEYERAKLKDNAINKSWKLVNDKLDSGSITDKQAMSLAGNIALKDLGNEKRSESFTDARQLHITNINTPLLNEALDKLKQLQHTDNVEIINASNRDDDI